VRQVLRPAPAETGTRVHIDTDLAVLGKLREFGQPIIRKKADTLLEELARHLRSVLVTGGSESHVPPPSAAIHG
jgi:carbon monoxide dehydrogenase subunit G